jgi:hypothetical protein
MFTGAHKTERMNCAFVDILERYQNDGDEFLDHIVTGDGTWVLFLTVETNE